MPRHRLFRLMAQREGARAARAGAAAAAAQNRALAATAAADRHASLAAELESGGPVNAAVLTAQKRLAAGLAAEAARQRDLQSAATAEALRLRHLLARHDMRRRLFGDAALQARMQDRAEAERRASEALPGPRGTAAGMASGLQMARDDPESAE